MPSYVHSAKITARNMNIMSCPSIREPYPLWILPSILAVTLAISAPIPAQAQSVAQARVVASCGGATYTAGQNAPITVDTTGAQCNNDAGGGGVTPVKPGALTIVPLDVSTVTTGGTAVTALIAGHRAAGGFLLNPVAATIALCINEQGTASGTTSAGALTCVQPGQSYTLAPSAAAVSVITSDSAHPFSGYGLN